MEIKEEWINQAKVNSDEYNQMYSKSVNENDDFWNEQGKRIQWIKDYTKIKKIKYSKNVVDLNWYYD